MPKTISFNDLEQRGRNLYLHDRTYYRLFAAGMTPNGCWLVAPEMRELVDIATATGREIYGPARLHFDGVAGTVPASAEYVRS